MSIRRWNGSLIALALLGMSACADAEPETYTYLSLLGADTIRFERFSYTDSTLTGDLVVRSPVTRMIHYHGRIGDDGSMETFTVEASTPPSNPGGPPAVTTTMTFDGNAVEMAVTGPDGENTVSAPQDQTPIPSLGQTPYVISAMAEAVRRARLSGSENYPVHLVLPGQTGAYVTAVENGTGSDIVMRIFGDPMYITLDESGAIESVSGRETTMKMETTRLLDADLDFGALASEYAARDAAGEGIGTPSPLANFTSQVDGATISVRYSQPAMRGRTIWGELVPYGEVWRTGANAATHLTTDRPLIFGDVAIAPGTYTLWSTYTEGSAELIINSQISIWGTAHDPANDIASIPMTVEEVSDAMERFTIAVEDGRITLTWDHTRFSVPFTVD